MPAITPTVNGNFYPGQLVTIRVTRSVRLRGGRSVPVGVMSAWRYSDHFAVAHPSGIEGARAYVPAASAVLVQA